MTARKSLKDLLLSRLPAPWTRAAGEIDHAPTVNPQTNEIGPGAGDQRLRPAAVLVPIIDHDHGPSVLLTERAQHLSAHAGQVSFPGGGIEPGDPSPVAAALREAEEEVGLDPGFVTVIGGLDLYLTGSGFRIHPIVGLVRPGFSLAVDESEVAAVFEVPLAFLMDPLNHERHVTHWGGQDHQYYAMPYNGHQIWGATAGMIVNLYHKLFGP